jgi:hypothetical protein
MIFMPRTPWNGRLARQGYQLTELGRAKVRRSLWRGCRLAYDPLGASTGGSVINRAYQRQHGTRYNDTTYESGAWSFDGTDYIRVPANDWLYCSPKMTVSFWCKSTTTNYATNAYVVSMHDYVGSNRTWAVRVVSVGDYWGVITSNNGAASSGEETTQAVETGWHFISVSTADDGSEWEFYYDGDLIDTLSNPSPYSDQGSFLEIGGLSGGNGWDGLIRDVRIYDRALPAELHADLAIRQGIAYECQKMPTYFLPAASSSFPFPLFAGAAA